MWVTNVMNIHCVTRPSYEDLRLIPGKPVRTGEEPLPYGKCDAGHQKTKCYQPQDGDAWALSTIRSNRGAGESFIEFGELHYKNGVMRTKLGH